MLSSILRVVYFSPAEWVAKEYLLHRCKSGAWKQANDDESLKQCWNLDRILEVEQFGDLKPNDLTMNDLLGDMDDDNGERELIFQPRI